MTSNTRGGEIHFGKELCSRCLTVLDVVVTSRAGSAESLLAVWMDYVLAVSHTSAECVDEPHCSLCGEAFRGSLN